jgi:dihydroorotase
MKTTLIENARLIDPKRDIDAKGFVYVEGACIESSGTGDPSNLDPDQRIDAEGKILAPGLVDIHTHLREPGNEEEETIASGAASAVAGGFTSIAAMPNTQPAVDNEASTEFVILQAKRRNLAKVYPIGAVTVDREGEKLAELAQMVRGGAVAFTDDGRPVENANIMRQALEYTRMFDTPIINHAENLSLSADGVMNESNTSVRLGLSGIPAVSEEVMVHRDIMLAELTGAHIHIAHVSTAGSVELIRNAREKGIHVTGEVTPHHISLTDEKLETFDPVYKMKPPLRTQEDVEALKEGLKDGTIDAIATDHAPHTNEEKEGDITTAPFGVIGLESALPVAIEELIDPGILDWPELINVLSTKPANLLNLNAGSLKPGSPADVVVIDPDREWTIDATEFESLSENCPFEGWDVRGRPDRVFVDGREVLKDGQLTNAYRQ